MKNIEKTYDYAGKIPEGSELYGTRQAWGDKSTLVVPFLIGGVNDLLSSRSYLSAAGRSQQASEALLLALHDLSCLDPGGAGWRQDTVVTLHGDCRCDKLTKLLEAMKWYHCVLASSSAFSTG